MFIGDQEHGLSAQAEPPLAKCSIFFHRVMYQFHKTILTFEEK